MLSFVMLVVGFALLVWGADKFVEGASALARKMGVSPLLVGLTIVAFGTSMPELAVSVTAALQGANEISARTCSICSWSRVFRRSSVRS